ncbi:hypothetical protein FisN_7Lh249 [Fistulifera solaris]|uniref:Arrestin C-terminal-like domain-containing protein n=1 Tax=Fistulifera solaris TaxID=1519565 RepID=A0A1Z5JRK0_FISSO|nr:hypothetical protein FisN_7Lh249 [Fistulifera solaris]|eukprot:GAX16526.1 hypothetical protein FisN_7Lh249 [Fistulifera solaris]
MTQTATTELPFVEFALARPYARIGGVAVGMIRISDDSRNGPSLRKDIESFELLLSAHCRLDARWHGRSLPAVDDDLWDDWPSQPNNICLWTSNRLDLMNLQERDWDSWQEVRPKPFTWPGRKVGPHTPPPEMDVVLEDMHLAFTFRFDLPMDQNLPPTLAATSCRYYYNILARLQTKELVRWFQIPIQVLTASPLYTEPHSQDEESVLQAMAHSSGLPAGEMSMSQLYPIEGRITVHDQQSAAFGQHTSLRIPSRQMVQSMRVTDPLTERPVCIITFIGASVLHPGSRMVVKLDFPKRFDDRSREWIPVFQVSTCLDGEETVIRFRDGQRTRARAYLFDTAHEGPFDPECVESISLNLVMPLDAPVSVQTDHVEVKVRCVVDIVVGEDYRNLRLEMPCEVVHPQSAWEMKLMDENETLDLWEIDYSDYSPTDPSWFPVTDIGEELDILSLHLADRCQIRPYKTYASYHKESEHEAQSSDNL